jgi:hypothetical protein
VALLPEEQAELAGHLKGAQRNVGAVILVGYLDLPHQR